jgi:hypothetical protein
MRHQNSVLHQILQVVPWGRFEALVERHGTDDRVRRLSTKSQLVALLHAQLSGAQSLREIETTLRSHKARLYHAGVTAPARSTLADANAKRPAALFADLFAEVLRCAHPGLRRQAREAIHLIDATSIGLNALSLDWADYAAHGAALKIHVDYRPGADIPTAFAITPARINDITAAKTMALDAGATYVFDLGYYDFSWFSALHAAGCRFVTRLKSHTRPRVLGERRVASGDAVRADRDVCIDGRLKSARAQRHPLSGVALREVEVVIATGKTLRILTNDLTAPARAIADLYKTRWLVELFFRWIKQNLKITRFIAVNENAVRIQIAVALITFLLLRIAARTQAPDMSLLAFARLVRANLMQLRPLHQLARPPPPPPPDPRQLALQLS